LLVPRFKSSKYSSIPPVLTLKRIKSDGKSRAAGKTRPRRDFEPKSFFEMASSEIRQNLLIVFFPETLPNVDLLQAPLQPIAVTAPVRTVSTS
jgi:hypothetical protein